MADQSIALQTKAPDIDITQPMLAFQRLKMGEQALLQQQQQTQGGQDAQDDQLMRQAVAVAGDDPQAFDSAMQQAAQRGSRSAQEYLRNPGPLAMQRYQRAYGGGAGPLMQGGKPQQGQAGGGGMAEAPDITQSQGFIQKWGGMKPQERANMLRGMAQAAQILPTVRDQAGLDKMIDDLKADGHPEAENLRGPYNPMAIQKIHDTIGQIMRFGGAQQGAGIAGVPYAAPTEDMKVGDDIVQHDIGAGTYTQKYHAQPTAADDWQFIGTTEDGKPISQNRRTGEQKTGEQKIGAKPGVVRPGRATEIHDMLVRAGYSEADATALAAGQAGMTPQKALEIGMRTATQGEFLTGPAANTRAHEIADELMSAAPAPIPAPTAPAPRQPGVIPNPVAPPARAPAAAAPSAAAPPQAAVEHLRQNRALAPMFDQKYGPGAAAKVLGSGPQSMNDPSRFTGEGGAVYGNAEAAGGEPSFDEAAARRNVMTKNRINNVPAEGESFVPGISTPVSQLTPQQRSLLSSGAQGSGQQLPELAAIAPTAMIGDSDEATAMAETLRTAPRVGALPTPAPTSPKEQRDALMARAPKIASELDRMFPMKPGDIASFSSIERARKNLGRTNTANDLALRDSQGDIDQTHRATEQAKTLVQRISDVPNGPELDELLKQADAQWDRLTPLQKSIVARRHINKMPDGILSTLEDAFSRATGSRTARAR